MRMFIDSVIVLVVLFLLSSCSSYRAYQIPVDMQLTEFLPKNVALDYLKTLNSELICKSWDSQPVLFDPRFTDTQVCGKEYNHLNYYTRTEEKGAISINFIAVGQQRKRFEWIVGFRFSDSLQDQKKITKIVHALQSLGMEDYYVTQKRYK